MGCPPRTIRWQMESRTSSRSEWRPSPRVFVALVLVGVLIGLWRIGTFDDALVHVGLNAQECAKNALGATFCGDDLENYRREVIEPIQRQQEAIEAERRAQEEALLRQEEDELGFCIDGSRERLDTGCQHAVPDDAP